MEAMVVEQDRQQVGSGLGVNERTMEWPAPHTPHPAGGPGCRRDCAKGRGELGHRVEDPQMARRRREAGLSMVGGRGQGGPCGPQRCRTCGSTPHHHLVGI